jgi:hypothetical protein
VLQNIQIFTVVAPVFQEQKMDKNVPPLRAWIWTAGMLVGMTAALAAYGFLVLGDLWLILS